MRELIFLGDSLEVLREFPDEVKQDIGYALHFAQEGKTHHQAKPFKGYSGVMEIVAPFKKDTYRAVYALKIGSRIYVLHAFQKNQNMGSKRRNPNWI